MTRRLRNLLALLSLLLCVAVAVSWVRSYLPEQFHVRSYRGRVLLIFSHKQYANMFDAESQQWAIDQVLQTLYAYAAADPGLVQARGAGFEVIVSSPIWVFAVPHWALLLPPAALGSWGLWLARRPARRAARGQCPSCGYDLRETPTRCPECGAAPAT